MKPAVGAAGFKNILLLPDIIVSGVLLFVLNIKFPIPAAEADKCKDADVNPFATNIKLPDVSVKVMKLPLASVKVWSPVNVLEPVVA